MTAAPIDLGALSAFDQLDTGGASGRPVLLDIGRVHEDPAQPRKTFDDFKQQELSASIAESGIRVPVSVRPHPILPGHYMLNFGARRRRAAIAVGLTAIPALIEDLLTDFDQVIENLQRAELTPMEMALFISGKQKQGMKAAEIARRLGLTRSAISKYFALIDAPPEIEAVYTSGRSTSPDTIYDLRNLYSRWPEATRQWLGENDEVTRRSIDVLKRSLLQSEELAVEAAPRRKSVPPNPGVIRRPVMVIRVSDRLGTIILNRRAAADGHVLVKWDDTAEVDEVALPALQLVRLDDARRYEPLNRSSRLKRSKNRSRGER